MNYKIKLFSEIEKIAALIPTPVFWEDLNGVVLGGNDLTFQGVGAKREDIIGKSLYELYPIDVVNIMLANNRKVIHGRKPLEFEESNIDVGSKKTRWWRTTRAPLFDQDEINIIGIIGSSVEITDSKEKERLELENELQKNKIREHENFTELMKIETEIQKAQIEEQNKFRKIANQLAHDIRSPLASLSIILDSCKAELSEQKRLTLQEAAARIRGIANSLLNKYDNEVLLEHQQQATLVSLILLNLLDNKKHQCKDLPVKFTSNFEPNCDFAFIDIEPLAFNRAIVNLIDNAVDALDGREGLVAIDLRLHNGNIEIIIQDNGKGMPPKIVNKLMNNIAVTYGKKGGNGIGFTQVSETIKNNHGDFTIVSEPGIGTKITVTFPKAKQPDWMIEEIHLNQGDTVVILDDDSSIHRALDIHFKDYLGDINLKHFIFGADAIDFINNFPDKSKIVLLADFELLKQELNGLQVIERTKIKRSILVTSHYSDQRILNLALENGVKVLPKQLAAKVLITINAQDPQIVIIDDDELFVNSLADFVVANNKTVAKYYDPLIFLKELSQYAKDTMICMDNNFNSSIDGLGLAKQLHELGYTKLCLLSGADFKPNDVPAYLTMVLKTDIANLYKILGCTG